MVPLKCKHEEHIDEKGLGVCKKCGRVRQYDYEHPLNMPTLIQEGNKPEDTAEHNDVSPRPITSHEARALTLWAAVEKIVASPELSVLEISKTFNIPDTTLNYYIHRDNLRPRQKYVKKATPADKTPKIEVKTFTPELAKELLELGIDKFREKYHWRGKGFSGLANIYARVSEGKPVGMRRKSAAQTAAQPAANTVTLVPQGLPDEIIIMLALLCALNNKKRWTPQCSSNWKHLFSDCLDFCYPTELN